MKKIPNINLKDTRFKVFICNMVIIGLCLLCIAFYFFMPFWKVSVSVNVNGETLTALMGEDSSSDSSSSDSSTENGDSGESEMDLGAMLGELGEEGFSISLSITLKTTDILASLSSDATDTVNGIIETNVNSIVDQLEEPLNKLVKSVVKVATKTVLKESVKEQIKSAFTGEDEKTAEEVQQILNDAGLSDEDIDREVDELMDFFEEAPTVEEATDKLVDTLEEFTNNLAQSGNTELEDMEMDEETKAEMKESIEEVLNEIAVDGKIDLDNMTSLFLSLLEGEEGEGGEGGEGSGLGGEENGLDGKGNELEGEENSSIEKMSAISPLSASSDSAEQQDAAEELKEKFRTMIMEKIPEDAAESIASAMKYISYVILFTFFTWFYLILKILAKLKRTNNAIKLKLPIWLGWLPYLVLCLLPNSVFSMLANPPAALADMMGPETVETMGKVFSMISIKFTSGSIFSFIVAIAFIFFSLFYYGRMRKKLKRVAKAMKKGLYPTPEMLAAEEAAASESSFDSDYASNDSVSDSFDSFDQAPTDNE